VEEDWNQIGRRLREAREAAGLTVEDVVYQAHLPRSVVEALEAEDFSVFASPIYAKSFLSQYSDFIGVDASPWLDALVPVPFLSGETFTPLIDNRFIPVETSPPREPKSFIPALWLTLLTGVVLFAGIKGYQFLDEKLADQELAPTAEQAAPSTATASLPDPPPPAPVEEETVHAPPRAIIVED
jgi:cytoskeletal protein RodZ